MENQVSGGGRDIIMAQFIREAAIKKVLLLMAGPLRGVGGGGKGPGH